MAVCRKKDEKVQRSGHASLNLRYRTGKHTGDYFLGDPKDTVYQAIRNAQVRGVSSSLCLSLASWGGP